MNKVTSLLALLALLTLLFSACESSQDLPIDEDFPVDIPIVQESIMNLCLDFELEENVISSEEEYLIIEALSQRFDDFEVFLDQKTDVISDSRLLTSDVVEVDPLLVERYIEVNSQPSFWGENLSMRFDLIPDEEIACLFENYFWDDFYAKYPDSEGIISFGRPVINDNGEALVITSYSCNTLCGGGSSLTLVKENGIWVIDEVIVTWLN